MRKKINKNKNKRRKERPNIKYKLIRLKKILRVKRIEEISQIDKTKSRSSGLKQLLTKHTTRENESSLLGHRWWKPSVAKMHRLGF